MICTPPLGQRYITVYAGSPAYIIICLLGPSTIPQWPNDCEKTPMTRTVSRWWLRGWNHQMMVSGDRKFSSTRKILKWLYLIGPRVPRARILTALPPTSSPQWCSKRVLCSSSELLWPIRKIRQTFEKCRKTLLKNKDNFILWGGPKSENVNNYYENNKYHLTCHPRWLELDANVTSLHADVRWRTLTLAYASMRVTY